MQGLQEVWKVIFENRGAWISTPFTNWKNAVEKMKAREKSNTQCHVQATQAALALEGARSEGSIIQQLQRLKSQEIMENRAAI